MPGIAPGVNTVIGHVREAASSPAIPQGPALFAFSGYAAPGAIAARDVGAQVVRAILLSLRPAPDGQVLIVVAIIGIVIVPTAWLSRPQDPASSALQHRAGPAAHLRSTAA